MRFDHLFVKAVFIAALLAAVPLGTAQAQVAVTSATPSSAPQGTVALDVEIAGSGFDSSAQVEFLVTGSENPGGITVKKVVVRGSKKLIATIDVADDASVADFDIQVTLSGGRKGKGITLFKVQAKVANANDPCLDPTLDFPAFTYYWVNAIDLEILVTDADGRCNRSIVTPSDGMPQGGAVSFSYPIAGTSNVGRVVWRAPGWQSANWRDFVVNDIDRTISLGPVRSTLVGHDIGGMALSKDGNTLYVGSMPQAVGQSGSIYRLAIADPLATPVLLHAGPASPGVLSYYNVSVSADESTLVVEEKESVPDQPSVYRTIRICLTGEPCSATLFESAQAAYPAVSADGATVALSDYLDGSNNCRLLIYLDADGQPLNAGTQPRYGRDVSWLDGEILANGVSTPNRRNRCSGTDTVVKIDPATGAEVTLVRGYYPDAR